MESIFREGEMRPQTWRTALPCVGALAMLLVATLHAAPPARTVKVAVLTPGLGFGEVLAGEAAFGAEHR